eukprot:8599162-Pyramimonas_sp.AAC.1
MYSQIALSRETSSQFTKESRSRVELSRHLFRRRALDTQEACSRCGFLCEFKDLGIVLSLEIPS